MLPLFFLFVLSVFPAAADTVMVYTEDSGGVGAVKESRGYLEDGIMESFFEAGHIVFNAFPETAEDLEEPEGFSERVSVRLAKSGGANLLLEIGMSFSEDEEELLPVSARYRFYELGSGSLLAEGKVVLEEMGDREELGKEEILRRLGEAVAAGALAKL